MRSRAILKSAVFGVLEPSAHDDQLIAWSQRCRDGRGQASHDRADSARRALMNWEDDSHRAANPSGHTPVPAPGVLSCGA